MSDNKINFTSWEAAVEWLINQQDQKELVEACYYDRPASKAAERFWRSSEWCELRKYFPQKKGTALDVGAGMGIASYALAKDGWKTTALEPDGSSLVGAGAIRNLAEENNIVINIEQTLGEKLPLPDNSFDLVHARQVLHHSEDLGGFCQEMHRVLAPQGVFVATREHVISNVGQLQVFLKNHPLHRYYGGENAYELAVYKKALIDAGFRIRLILGPLESVINYAPLTEEALYEEIVSRASSYPGGHRLFKFLFSTIAKVFDLTVLSRLDRRPGRLFTFICIKGN